MTDVAATAPAARPPAWTEVTARVAGLWLLAGCFLKAFLGTPGDLPEIVRKAPLPIGTTFALVVGIEAFVGLATCLRPGRAWPFAGALLVFYAVVLATLVAGGAPSCGCFGAKIRVPPVAMLAADAGFLALLLVSRPWRLRKGGRADAWVALAAAALAIALPILTDREGGVGKARGGLKPWVAFDVASWKGKPVKETDLAKWGDLSDARDGLWILYRESCEVCADCLRQLSFFDRGEREITLVRLSESPDAGKPRVVHEVPHGPFVHVIVLPDDVDWVVTAPARLVVEDGVVTEAKAPIDPNDPKECR